MLTIFQPIRGWQPMVLEEGKGSSSRNDKPHKRTTSNNKRPVAASAPSKLWWAHVLSSWTSKSTSWAFWRNCRAASRLFGGVVGRAASLGFLEESTKQSTVRKARHFFNHSNNNDDQPRQRDENNDDHHQATSTTNHSKSTIE